MRLVQSDQSCLCCVCIVTCLWNWPIDQTPSNLSESDSGLDLKTAHKTESQILNVLRNPSPTQWLLWSQGQWRATDASPGTPWRAPNKRHVLKMAHGFLQHQSLVWKIIEIEVSTLKHLFFYHISFNFGVFMNFSRLPYESFWELLLTKGKANTSTAVKRVESM